MSSYLLLNLFKIISKAYNFFHSDKGNTADEERKGGKSHQTPWQTLLAQIRQRFSTKHPDRNGAPKGWQTLLAQIVIRTHDGIRQRFSTPKAKHPDFQNAGRGRDYNLGASQRLYRCALPKEST
eukprot:sb/3475737/